MPSTPLCFLAASRWRSASRHACANPQYQTFRRVHKGAHEAAGLVRGDTPCFLDVWQAKGLESAKSYVWQGKELRTDLARLDFARGTNMWPGKDFGTCWREWRHKMLE